MATILDIQKKYRESTDLLDLDLIISRGIKKTREFILSHPEKLLTLEQEKIIIKNIKRRMHHEPLAYILGEKEFYGLPFVVHKNVLIPRPETELLVDCTLTDLKQRLSHTKEKIIIADVGTGSGNIIISIANKLLNQESGITNYAFYGIDISKKALVIAKKNASSNKVSKNIKFIQGNLLKPLLKIGNWKLEIGNSTMIIVANLPYLSSALYASSNISVKKFEPQKALLSQKNGLAHYENLLQQLKKIRTNYPIECTIFMEISPEQKTKINAMIKKHFPKSKIKFHKDLSGRWRVCEIKIYNYQ